MTLFNSILNILKQSRQEKINADELSIIMFIFCQENPPTMGDIANELGISSPAMTQRIDRMEKKQLVTRQTPENYRSKFCIHLTDKALSILKKLNKDS